MFAALYTALSILAFLSLYYALYTGRALSTIQRQLQSNGKQRSKTPTGAVILCLGIAATLFGSLAYTTIAGVHLYETCETTTTNKTTTTTANTTTTNTTQTCDPHTYQSTAVAYLYAALALIALLLTLIYAF